MNAPWEKWSLKSGKAKYRQIVELIRESIHKQELSMGDKLPSQRDLAALLGVDFTTVTRAYSAATDAGLIESKKGSGAYVKQTPLQTARLPSDLYHFDLNIPPFPESLNLQQEMAATLKKLMIVQSVEELSRYESEFTGLRGTEAAQTWLSPHYPDIVRHTVLTSFGAQQAIFAILAAHTRAGDTVVAEALTYPGFLLACRQLGLHVHTLPEDGDGPLPESLADLCERAKPRLFYINPTLHNPTTRTIGAKRRQELADVICRYALPTIEDDPYRFLCRNAPAPLISHTRGQHVYHIATLSKAITVLLRTAFVVAPLQSETAPLVRSLRSLMTVEPTLLTGTAAMWISSGQAKKFSAEIQKEAEKRQILAHNILQDFNCSQPREGLHLWLNLPADCDNRALLARLALSKILVADAASFSPTVPQQNGLRISLGALPAQRLEPALLLLRNTLADYLHTKNYTIV